MAWGDRGLGAPWPGGDCAQGDTQGAFRGGQAGRCGSPCLPRGLSRGPRARGSWAAPGGGALLTPRARPALLGGRPGTGFAEGGRFRHSQGSGPQRDRSLTVHQPAGIRAGPATPPRRLLGRVQGESQASPAGDCALFPRVRLASAILCPAVGSACAVGWGSPASRLPSGGACADIACPTVGQRTRAVPATVPPPEP